MFQEHCFKKNNKNFYRKKVINFFNGFFIFSMKIL